MCEMVEKKRRIQVAIWACAYEIYNTSLVSDQKFDETCLLIDASKRTDRPDLDDWFKDQFHPDTGQWIYKHPELDRIMVITKSILTHYNNNTNKTSN